MIACSDVYLIVNPWINIHTSCVSGTVQDSKNMSESGLCPDEWNIMHLRS